MKKKILALLLASAMVLGLAGCNGAGGSTSSTQSTKTESGTGSSASGKIAHIKMAFLTWTGAPADTKIVQDAMNEITRKKLGIEVELQISDAGSFKQNMTLALSGGEKIDIINTMMANYPSLVDQGYLVDLEKDNLLSTYGKGIVDAVGKDAIDACRANGKLYGLPNNRDYAQGRGCTAIGTEYLTKVGYTAPKDAGEIVKTTQADVDALLAKIHAAFPDKETYRPTVNNSFAQSSDVDQLGGTPFGVLLNYGEKLKVENLFTSDVYMNYCKRMYDYNKKGYISKDAATDTTAVTTLTASGKLMSYTTGGKPGIKMQESTGDNRDMTIFQTNKDFIASNAISLFPWAIPITTSDAKTAMIYLNELYTNPELTNLLIYGIKDKHYKVLSDGTAEVIRDASGGSAYGTLPFIAPNQYLSYPSKGNDPKLWDTMRTFNSKAAKSAACGFTFNSSSVATEMTAVQNVYDEYTKSLEFGFIDPAVGIPEMNKKMMAAGLQKIIDEKQKQLDAWVAATKK